MGDSGGIYSLSGFAYQIKVFFLQIVKLKRGYTLEYETIDDVALKMTAENIDDHEDELCSILTVTRRKAIQVKRTHVTEKSARRIVKNWILADKNNNDIEEFILVSDREVDTNIFADLEDDIYGEISAATGNKSIDAKIKLIGYTETELKNKIQDIVSKSRVKKYENIDTEIVNKFKELLMGDCVSDATYYRRIKEFLQQIIVEILDTVANGQPYLLTYERMSNIRHSIIINFTDEEWKPNYYKFKKLNKVSLEDLAQIKTREYQQLKMCKNLNKEDIFNHLLWGEFYVNSKRGYFERGLVEIVEELEERAYENFCDVKMELRNRNSDTPDNRLIETKAKDNLKAVDEKIRYGVCINLTSKDTDKRIQISWKDD